LRWGWFPLVNHWYSITIGHLNSWVTTRPFKPLRAQFTYRDTRSYWSTTDGVVIVCVAELFTAPAICVTVWATVSGCGPVATLVPYATSREYVMSGTPRWALTSLDWLSSCQRRWLSAFRCDQSLVYECSARVKAAKPRAWMACRIIAVNHQRELPRGLQRPVGASVSHAPRWGLSPPDWPPTSSTSWPCCEHRLMMLTTLRESPPSRICLSCARWADR
jgi:hypothetical protein